MAQLATVLPSVSSTGVGILTGAEGGVVYSTAVFDGSTGLEVRNSAWVTGRHAWTLTFQGLLSEVQPVIDLFEEAGGMSKSFRFAPPGYVEGDFRFAADELRISFQGTGTPGAYIATITIPVIQVLGE